MKIYLPDISVWIALASRRHVHARLCAKWLSSVRTDMVMFCRVSQMGFLRLLTMRAVMGSDTLTSFEAWRVYGTFLGDGIGFASEPFGLDSAWQKLTSAKRSEPKRWTDAYLAAFATASRMRVVTLDRAMLNLNGDALLLSEGD